jgi:hypothetical protein
MQMSHFSWDDNLPYASPCPFTRILNDNTRNENGMSFMNL